MTTSTVNDLTVVGSSPIPLLHAIARKRDAAGDVLVLERDDVLGGMWRTRSLFGLDRVELGPHVMRRNRLAYMHLSDELGLDLVEMTPTPRRGVERSGKIIFVPYEQEWRECLEKTIEALTQAGTTIPTRLMGALRVIVRSAKQLVRFAGDGMMAQRYPRSGCSELIARLESTLQARGVLVRTGCNVQQIEIDTRAAVCTIRTSTGVMHARKVAITPHAENLRILLDGVPIQLPARDATTEQVHLLVSSNHGAECGFTFLGDDVPIRMISDISRFTPGFHEAYPGCSLLAAWVNPSMVDSGDAAAILAHLAHYGLLERDVRLVSFNRNTVVRSKLEDEAVAMLETKLNGFITILRTDDLTADLKGAIPVSAGNRLGTRPGIDQPQGA